MPAIGPMRITYASIFKPKANPSGQLKYSASFLIPKNNQKLVEQVQNLIKAATEKGKASKWGGKIPKFKNSPLRDGDEELASGEKTGAEYKGMYFINTSSDNPPGCIDRSGKPVTPDELYSGCWVFADVNAYPFQNSGSNGVGWGLNHVLLVKAGERLDGRTSVDEAFKDVQIPEDMVEDTEAF